MHKAFSRSYWGTQTAAAARAYLFYLQHYEKTPKQHQIIFLGLVLLSSSSATILNQPIQKVALATDKNIKAVFVSKSLSVDISLIRIDAPRFYYIVRNPKSIAVELRPDSTQKTVFLQTRNSFAYWANLYFNCGIGMLVNRDNTKR